MAPLAASALLARALLTPAQPMKTHPACTRYLGFCSLAALLAATPGCSNGPESDQNTMTPPKSVASEVTGDKSTSAAPLVFSERAEPAGKNCPNAGVALLSGPDTNRNGVLDSTEITATQYVCNGTDGHDGKDSLIKTTSVAKGSTACPTGGIAMATGLDANGNGSLDKDEISCTNYVCNGATGAQGPAGAQGPTGARGAMGAPGATGPQGPAGAPGTNGLASLVVLMPQAVGSEYCSNGGQGIYTGLDLNGDKLLQSNEVLASSFVCNGANGAQGLTALVASSAEPAGSNCPQGGTRIDTGLDLDGNAKLDTSEVTQTSYACNGAPGPTGATGAEGPAGATGPQGPAGATGPAGPPGSPGAAGSSGSDNLPVLTSKTELDPVALPPYGGEKVQTYKDLNLDGQLEPGEVISTTHLPILHGASSGSCGAGKKNVPVGLDLDLDGTLEANEVTSDTCIALATQVSMGENSACAAMSDGTARCWGYGSIGNGSFDVQYTAVTVTGIDSITSVAVGNDAACAVLSDGTARCWGYNDEGELGDGTTNESAVPVMVQGLTNVSHISVGSYTTCAVLTDGTARCWGDNSYGTLGDGSADGYPALTPVAVAGLTGVASITTSWGTTCASLTDGTVWCWGYYGSFDGDNFDVATPTRVASVTGAVSVAVGYGYACAVLTDASVSCWGYNGGGVLGNGTFDDSLQPVPVTGIDNAVSISALDYMACAALADGTARCWGEGTLGDGTTTDTPLPITVPGLAGVTSIAASSYASCATVGDGSVLCWGDSVQLGDGGVSSATPVPVIGLN